MTMTVDTTQQQHFGHLPFSHMSSYQSHPHFTNPWVASSSGSQPQSGSQAQAQALLVGPNGNTSLPHLNLNNLPKLAQHGTTRPSATSGAPPPQPLAPYGSIPVTAPSAGSSLVPHVYRQQSILTASQDVLGLTNRMAHPASSSTSYDSAAYTATAASPVNSSYTPSPAAYDQMGYAHGHTHAHASAPAPIRSTPFTLHPDTESSRRYSQQSVASSVSSLSSNLSSLTGSSIGIDGPPSPRKFMSDFDHSLSQQQHAAAAHHSHHQHQHDDRKSFQDALEASHGMLSMSQETPRNIYDVRSRQRGSNDGYGFPSTAHSTSSSVSSTGFGSYYGGGSVDGSVSDYSTAGSDIESLTSSSRTPLPRPGGHSLLSSQPPAPQSMMGQFSSKVSSSTQKKHKCKVCDKRFTRPSSLQTHMYSHTGEKPFSCEVENCGRQFSVVSNLRRHRKVHKNHQDSGSQADTPSDAGSEDRHSGDE